MAYPKPLSEKTLAGMKARYGIKDEMNEFLHLFFAACANLYGSIELKYAWEILKGVLENTPDAPKIRRKDLIAFSEIARREEQPYYVAEVDELFNEPRSDMLRHIVHRDLFPWGFGETYWFYELREMRMDEPFCVPGDEFLTWANPQPGDAEKKLFVYLSNLRSTAEECIPPLGAVHYPNKNRGKLLSDFSFLNGHEAYEQERKARSPWWMKRLKSMTEGTEAEKLMRMIRREDRIGVRDPNRILQDIFDELTEAGVELNEKKMQQIADLFIRYHNGNPEWVLSGWSPEDLMQLHADSLQSGPGSVSFGPGIQKMFESGEMDKEELIAKIRELGIIVDDD